MNTSRNLITRIVISSLYREKVCQWYFYVVNRFLIFSVHVKVLVTLFFYKVIGGCKPVFVKQLTAVLALHLVGLTSAFLNKAEPMTVERFVHSEVLEAVSHQCTVCQSGVGGSSSCLFTSSLTICLRCV